MPAPDEPRGLPRTRQGLLSKGHNPPRYVDRELPTYETRIFADGGPGKLHPGALGSNPWILGSLTIGSGNIWNITFVEFTAGSPNAYFKLRHNRSGTNASNPGGTLETWYLAARGRLSERSAADSPLRSVRGPGTYFLYGFGAGSVAGTTSNRVHRALGSRAVDRFSGLIRGYVT